MRGSIPCESAPTRQTTDKNCLGLDRRNSERTTLHQPNDKCHREGPSTPSAKKRRQCGRSGRLASDRQPKGLTASSVHTGSLCPPSDVPARDDVSRYVRLRRWCPRCRHAKSAHFGGDGRDLGHQLCVLRVNRGRRGKGAKPLQLDRQLNLLREADVEMQARQVMTTPGRVENGSTGRHAHERQKKDVNHHVLEVTSPPAPSTLHTRRGRKHRPTHVTTHNVRAAPARLLPTPHPPRHRSHWGTFGARGHRRHSASARCRAPATGGIRPRPPPLATARPPRQPTPLLPAAAVPKPAAPRLAAVPSLASTPARQPPRR